MRCPRSCPSIDDCPSLDYCLDSVERCVKVTEPAYAALAAVLVLGDAFVFFTTVIHEVRIPPPPARPYTVRTVPGPLPCGSHVAMPLSCLAGHSGEAPPKRAGNLRRDSAFLPMSWLMQGCLLSPCPGTCVQAYGVPII